MLVIIPIFLIYSRLELYNTFPGLILASTAWTLPYAVLLLRKLLRVRSRGPGGAGDGGRVHASGRLPASHGALVGAGVVAVSVFVFIWAWGTCSSADPHEEHRPPDRGP